MSVTRDQCDARLTVTFPVARHHHQLLGDRGTCMLTCPGLHSTAGKKKKNIYFANSKNNYNTNIMCKTEAGFQKGNRPSCWTPLAMLNITSNI